MKKVILITLSLILITVPAFADFLDDFNRYADIHGIAQAKQFVSGDGSVYYMSDFIILTSENNKITVAGQDHIQTLAVACCALDSIDQKESYSESSGRIFVTYLDALKAEYKTAYSVLYGYIKIYVVISDNMIFVSMME